MTVEELLNLKICLQKKILDQLQEFEENTGLSITGTNLVVNEQIGEKSQVTNFEIVAEL